MAVMRVQGTNVFIFDGTAITKAACINGIDLGSDSTSKIENTCLEETDSKGYLTGLNDPGDGSITFNLDPENDTHLKIIELAEDRAVLTMYLGGSDGTGEPTVASGTVTLPTTRTFWSFQATLAPSTPTFEADSLVSYQITMQRKTGVKLIPKA
ncbi:phage tail tube protein [Acinetobacter nosocomialis]|uniref:phage tail tube protein n=1 Tax=Acinetobacter nosocomialis TaxID=106654 RepID=UPI0013CFBFF0|nr:phage tail tube protein [Acinetobacter nosocomialis]